MELPTTDGLAYKQKKRPSQRDILPGVIKLRTFSDITILQSSGIATYFTLNNGVQITGTITIRYRVGIGSENNAIFGAVPYQSVFMEGTDIPTGLVIPLEVTAGKYFTWGPTVEAPYQIQSNFDTGSTDTILRVVDSIYNNSGVQQNLILIRQVRYVIGGSGIPV